MNNPRNKKLSKSSKKLILNALAFCQTEKQANQLLIPLCAAQERVCGIFGIGQTTLTGVINESRKGEFSSPKRIKRSRSVTELDEFDQSIIRNTIYNMHKEKQHITLNTLQNNLVEEDIFHGSRSSLWRILHDMRFSWKQMDNKRFLMEEETIVQKRFRFLKTYMENKKCENPLPVVFIGETWIFQKGSVQKTWQDRNLKTVKETSPRFIAVHAGSKKGFINGSKFISTSKKIAGNYHDELNTENFTRWLQNQLLPALEEPSIIVLDNATYRNMLVESAPNIGSQKLDIQKWLRTKGIDFNENLFKHELLELVQIHKPAPKYLVDKIISEQGHTVLRIPPYHCQFNAIELIWQIIKKYYNDCVGKGGLSPEKLFSIWLEAIEHVTDEMWENAVCHTEKIIEEWWDREVIVDNEDINPLIITLDEESESEND